MNEPPESTLSSRTLEIARLMLAQHMGMPVTDDTWTAQPQDVRDDYAKRATEVEAIFLRDVQTAVDRGNKLVSSGAYPGYITLTMERALRGLPQEK